jgi:hypothetical protein
MLAPTATYSPGDHGVELFVGTVAKLRNPDAITVDTTNPPFAAWDRCFFLVQVLDCTYQPDGIRDPFSGRKTTKKKDEKATTKLDSTMTPAPEISYDKAPATPSPTQQVGGKTAEARSYSSSGCAVIWNQGEIGTGNEWYGALMVKLTAATCDTAAQLAQEGHANDEPRAK